MSSRSVKFAAIEDKVASFHRERVSEDVHEAHIGLMPGQTSEFHVHSVTRDTFYVLQGSLEVRVLCQGEATDEAYTVIGTPEVRREPCKNGVLHRVALTVGDVMVVFPKTIHASANVSGDTCSFICIEGPGEYDFIRCANPGVGEKNAV